MNKKTTASKFLIPLTVSGLCFSFLSVSYTTSKALADWTIAAYIQADNNLAPFAKYNIDDMQQVVYADKVNMLVEWDQPNNNKTWRYRIVQGGRIEDASLSTEMGINPIEEIVEMMKWAKSKYDATRFGTILWNHGAGVEDPRLRVVNKVLQHINSVTPSKASLPWLEIPGLSKNDAKERGILFDDSQGTYATNQDLTTACNRIKNEVLGKNLDLLGMDACLMAMIEVGYQIKDSVNVLVASQQTEPGEGWPYSLFLSTLSTNPSAYDEAGLGQLIVDAYGTFYNKNGNKDYTQSAISLSKLEAIKENISQVIAAIAECKKAAPIKTKRAVVNARRASISFDVPEYIDLHSFYTALTNEFKKPRKGKVTYAQAAKTLLSILSDGMKKITDAVIANQVGPQFAQAKGISIYYPKYGSIDPSYSKTIFAQNTNWINFITEYR